MNTQEKEKVNMIASGYEWICPTCDNLNHEIEALDQVTCRQCHEMFEAEPPEHACP